MFSVISAQAAGSAWLSGAGIGIGLFAIVGAQSAFILRQGIMRQHVIPIIATCFAIDAVFIMASVAGLRQLTAQLPWLTTVLLWGGVAFLTWYAAQSARRAVAGGGGMKLDDNGEQSLRAALMAAAGFSIINPHFWLDMMVIGSIADNFGESRMAFAIGVVTASGVWLTVQGLGARMLAPLFTKPSTWRILDGTIAVILSVLALTLAIRGVN
ncbi:MULTISPECIES: LysE family transporter [unclassified Stenotrophomonas]|jgi:L-lysine exporter family protein LysE/ArgO|uniref:LysE/ArgO family amino acid transporter n=1 Tax=unclassified Stenotrophomonas TaxID=196198 RepID=UPI000DB48E28|nr:MULTISPECIES: LysE family transporter [unclassified Stenotrophomonas]PZU29197.1 MAG: lysine transporter LysE [Stenotrophomonas sp.]